jgi:hypothetical protein
MAISVPKSAAFSVLVSVSQYRLAQFRRAPEIVREAVQVGAEFWHTKILPDHFDKGKQGKYGYAPRSIKYKKQHGGRPDLVFSGSLRRDIKSAASYSQSARTAVTVSMWARVLNLVPSLPQNSEDLYVLHGNKKKGGQKSYPNLKREIRVVTDDERALVAEVIQAAIVERFGVDPTQSRTLGMVAA